MPKRLKTYQTSLGFFDLAIAAPSMKAALEAWGARSNLFHQGAAKQSDDPEVIAATMSKPGVILRRPVGSHEPFTEHAHLPADLSLPDLSNRRDKQRQSKKQPPRRPIDKLAERQAALAFEKEQRQRERERRKENAARSKEQARREKAISKAQAALETAQREHESKVSTIATERAALEKRSQAEDDRWEKQKEKLKAALRHAQE